MTTDPITRLNAALEGRYRIECEIGEGGILQFVTQVYSTIRSILSRLSLSSSQF